MSGLRIFISHSAKTEAAKTLLCRLDKSLSEHGHTVWFDRDGLRSGEGWENTLHEWIHKCDIALVLLTKNTLRRSDYVPHEVSLLTDRWHCNSNFRLFPIYVYGEVDSKKVEKSLLGPSRIHQIQAFLISGEQEKENKEIKRLCEEIDSIAIDKPTKELCRLLSEIDDEILQERAKDLEITTNHWIPSNDLKQMLAAKMLKAGLDDQSVNTIQKLMCHLRRKEHLWREEIEYVIDLIGSYWVNYHSAQQIRKVAIEEKKSLCINGKNLTTAKLYVIRASTCDADDDAYSSYQLWPIINYDGIEGEAPEGEAPQEKVLTQLLCKQLLRSKEECKLQEELKHYATVLKIPVFVVMPSQGINRHHIQELIKSFPTVTFFLLTGPEPDQVLSKISNVESLYPKLEHGIEDRYCNQYEDHLKHLVEIMRKLGD